MQSATGHTAFEANHSAKCEVCLRTGTEGRRSEGNNMSQNHWQRNMLTYPPCLQDWHQDHKSSKGRESRKFPGCSSSRVERAAYCPTLSGMGARITAGSIFCSARPASPNVTGVALRPSEVPELRWRISCFSCRTGLIQPRGSKHSELQAAQEHAWPGQHRHALAIAANRSLQWLS
jgi:hypothetical protein